MIQMSYVANLFKHVEIRSDQKKFTLYWQVAYYVHCKLGHYTCTVTYKTDRYLNKGGNTN